MRGENKPNWQPIQRPRCQNQYQRYFSKQLLDNAKDTLVLNQFAKKADLPKGMGSKTIRFFRPVTAASANVQTLTEGTPIAVFTDLTYTAVDIDLVQFGEAMKWTDILGWTALLKVMEDGIDLMSEDCALKADDLTLAALAHATTGGTKRYSGGATTYAALGALTTTTGKFTADDPLDAMTRLHAEQGAAHQRRLRGHHRPANRSRSHEGRDLGKRIHLLGCPAALQGGGWNVLWGEIRRDDQRLGRGCHGGHA